MVFGAGTLTVSIIPPLQLWPDPGGPGTGTRQLAGVQSLFVSQVLPCFSKASSREDVIFMKISVHMFWK